MRTKKTVIETEEMSMTEQKAGSNQDENKGGQGPRCPGCPKCPATIRAIRIIAPLMVIVCVFVMLSITQALMAQAAPQYGFGTGQGRTDTVNANDHHTDSWDRFSHNYRFSSGGNYRHELGNPTTFNGFVQADVFTANVRRDANVTAVPPRYGIFSGRVQTRPSNSLFPPPQNPAFANTFPQANPNADPRFDTLQMGANAPNIGNPMNIHNVGQQGALQGTGIGGDGIRPEGTSNATGQHFQRDGEWFYQSGGNGSSVTTPAHDGFLPPTSIR